MINNFLTTVKFVFILYPCLIYAQSSTYFNKIYGGNDTISILAQAVVPIDSGYMVLGGYTDATHRALYAQKIDEQGNLQLRKDFEVGTPGNFTSLSIIEYGAQVLKDEKHLLVVYEKGQNICFTKLNFQGDTVWRKLYAKIGWQLGKMIVKTPDAGYIIAGMEQNLTADTVKAYSLKVDSLGNFEWDKNYIMGNDARFFTVQYTPWDNGYIFGGMGYSTATGYDMFVVKTDSFGDTLWTKHYGSTQNDCLAMVAPLTSMAEHQAGLPIEYIMTGCYQSNVPDILFGYVDYLYMAKLDSVGGIIWQKIYNTSKQNLSIQTFPIIKPNKSFVATGVYANYSTDYTAVPLIISFNADGSIAWSKAITLDPDKDSYIKDMRPTADGGYVLAGYQYSTPQTAWVLKIDSLGNTCSFVGCDSTIYTGGFPIGLEEVLGEGNANFSIVPNPTKDVVTIQLLNINTESLSLTICDLSGRLVQTIPIQGNTTTISTQQLATGIYLCKLSNSNETQKLVIIH